MSIIFNTINSFIPYFCTREHKPSSEMGLKKIFDKASRADPLNQNEVQFLHSLSLQPRPLKDRILSVCGWAWENETIKKIEVMSARVLSKNVDKQELSDFISESLDSLTNYPENQTAIARLIDISSGISHDYHELLRKIDALERNYFEDFREDLIDLVNKFNALSSPAPFLAGRQIYADQDFTIAYDAKGRLKIRQGEIAPLTLEFTQRLSSKQIDEIKDIYASIVNPNNYNRLGLMFDFMQFLNQLRRDNPAVSINEAYQLYTPNLLNIYDAYNSGDCYLTAFKMIKILEEKGIKSQFLGQSATNEWSVLPIPGLERDPIKWNSYNQLTKGVGHSFLAIPYLDENGQDNLLHFEVSFRENFSNEILSFREKDRKGVYEIYTQFSVIPNEILEPAKFGKVFLKGTSKYTLKEGDKILGVDLFSDNFYVNSKLSKLLTDTPKNAEGRISFDLSDLVDNRQNKYFINGKPVFMTSQDALKLVVEKIHQHIHLPVEFFDSLLNLAQCREEIHSELLLKENSLIKSTYPKLTQIATKLKMMEDQNHPNYSEIFNMYMDCASCLNQGNMDKFNAILINIENRIANITS